MPFDVSPTQVSVLGPTSLAVPAQYKVWVATAAGTWSNAVALSLNPRPAQPPTITGATPQFPALKTIVRGGPFKDGDLVTMGADFLWTRFIDPTRLMIRIPQGTSPGSHPISVRGSAPFSLVVLKPPSLNLLTAEIDRSGSLLNPIWGWQAIRLPGASDYYPDPRAFLRNQHSLPVSDTVSTDSLDNDSSWACADSFWRNGPAYYDLQHVNWLYPVTFDNEPGTDVAFTSLSLNDRDNNMNFTAQAHAAATVLRYNRVELEFDSRETTAHFDQGWWSKFRETTPGGVIVTGLDNGMLANLTRATVTGLYGLDCAHDCHPELHPVWAMALYLHGVRQDTVALFVRNWGNEGYCSTTDWRVNFPNNRYVLRIPWNSWATSAVVSSEDMWMKKDAPVSVAYDVQPGDGIYVTFSLPDASRHPLAWGTVVIQWSGQQQLAMQRRSVGMRAAPQQLPLDNEERALEQWVERTAGPVKARTFRQLVQEEEAAAPTPRPSTALALTQGAAPAAPGALDLSRALAPVRPVQDPRAVQSADARLNALVRAGVITETMRNQAIERRRMRKIIR